MNKIIILKLKKYLTKLLVLNNLKNCIYCLSIFLPGIFGLLLILFHKFAVYTNGYDEAIYLSWGSAMSGEGFNIGFSYNWLIEKIIYFFHSINFSGTYINCFFDILASAVIMIFFLRIKNKLRLPYSYVFLLSLTFLFISTLFSRANPFEYLFSFFPFNGLFVASVEPYPFMFRTPNPQLSIILILVQLYLYYSENYKIKYLSFSFIPIVIIFSYPFLIPGYLIIILSLTIFKINKNRLFFYFQLIIYPILLLFLFKKVIIYILNFVPSKDNDFFDISLNLQNNHYPKFALISIFAVIIYILMRLCLRKYYLNNDISHKLKMNINLLESLSFASLIASIYSSNMQLFNGLEFELLRFITYGSVIWASLSISISYALLFKIIISYNFKQKFILKDIILYSILISTLIAYIINIFIFIKGWKYSSKAFQIFSSNQSEEISLKNYPLTDIFNDKRFYSEISGLVKAKTYPFLFSYPFNYTFYGNKERDEIIRKHILVYKNYLKSNSYNLQLSNEIKNQLGRIIYGYYWFNSLDQNKNLNDMIKNIE